MAGSVPGAGLRSEPGAVSGSGCALLRPQAPDGLGWDRFGFRAGLRPALSSSAGRADLVWVGLCRCFVLERRTGWMWAGSPSQPGCAPPCPRAPDGLGWDRFGFRAGLRPALSSSAGRADLGLVRPLGRAVRCFVLERRTGWMWVGSPSQPGCAPPCPRAPDGLGWDWFGFRVGLRPACSQAPDGLVWAWFGFWVGLCVGLVSGWGCRWGGRFFGGRLRRRLPWRLLPGRWGSGMRCGPRRR
ncbi:hypothetical protein EHYA_01499 [Embleya hyalina]|uniref:Uncharacterized protein n=1 Tax=Embleya hyalina TaxID=516124 RepID=A0A401YGZ8_9ACTN|nr:hypothetical protein EHYA_01499 [Embleya hyalina]